jgi:hypothetical protein
VDEPDATVAGAWVAQRPVGLGGEEADAALLLVVLFAVVCGVGRRWELRLRRSGGGHYSLPSFSLFFFPRFWDRAFLLEASLLCFPLYVAAAFGFCVDSRVYMSRSMEIQRQINFQLIFVLRKENRGLVRKCHNIIFLKLGKGGHFFGRLRNVIFYTGTIWIELVRRCTDLLPRALK